MGKTMFRRLGISADEFELMSYMTSWALCGHGTGASGRDDSDASEEEEDQVDSAGDARGDDGQGDDDDDDGPSSHSLAKKKRRCFPPGGVEPAAEAAPTTGVGSAVTTAVAATAAPKVVGGAMAFLSTDRFPMARRVAVGQKCKQLIDRGRLEWLQGRGCSRAEMVTYCTTDVSGENRLLLTCID